MVKYFGNVCHSASFIPLLRNSHGYFTKLSWQYLNSLAPNCWIFIVDISTLALRVSAGYYGLTNGSKTWSVPRCKLRCSTHGWQVSQGDQYRTHNLHWVGWNVIIIDPHSATDNTRLSKLEMYQRFNILLSATTLRTRLLRLASVCRLCARGTRGITHSS